MPVEPAGGSVGACFGFSKATGANKNLSDRHRADFFFHLGRVDHYDCIPWTAIEEAAVGAFADALFAADAEDGIDLDAAEWRMVLVRHPEHAVFYRAVLDAGGRARAPGAAFGNDGQFLGLLLARCREALGFRFEFELVGHHADGLNNSPSCGRHAGIIA